MGKVLEDRILKLHFQKKFLNSTVSPDTGVSRGSGSCHLTRGEKQTKKRGGNLVTRGQIVVLDTLDRMNIQSEDPTKKLLLSVTGVRFLGQTQRGTLGSWMTRDTAEKDALSFRTGSRGQ